MTPRPLATLLLIALALPTAAPAQMQDCVDYGDYLHWVLRHEVWGYEADPERWLFLRGDPEQPICHHRVAEVGPIPGTAGIDENIDIRGRRPRVVGNDREPFSGGDGSLGRCECEHADFVRGKQLGPGRQHFVRACPIQLLGAVEHEDTDGDRHGPILTGPASARPVM